MTFSRLARLRAPVGEVSALPREQRGSGRDMAAKAQSCGGTVAGGL